MNHQILRNTPATLELTVYSGGDPVDLDEPPALVITDGNGDTVSSGAVTNPAGVGTYASVLPAQTDLAVLRAAWTGTLGGAPLTLYQNYEVVGNVLFTEAEARSAPIVGGQPALEDETKYPDEVIGAWRSVITDLFEARLRRPVIQRYCRVKVGGATPLDLTYGYPTLASGAALHRPGRAWDIARIISATNNGDAVTVGDLTIAGHKVYNANGGWSRGTSSDPLNVVIEYEYGPDPVWPEAHQRGLDLLLANAVPKGYPSSATSLSNEDGTFRITTFPVAVEDFLKTHKRRKGFGIA